MSTLNPEPSKSCDKSLLTLFFILSVLAFICVISTLLTSCEIVRKDCDELICDMQKIEERTIAEISEDLEKEINCKCPN